MTLLKQIIQEEQLGDKAYKAIRDFIVSEKISSGFRLTESYLAKKLGISKTPIKEALGRLEKQGMIKISPRRGAFIASFKKKDIIEIYEVRAGLESLAIQLSKNINHKILSKLRKASEDIIVNINNNDYEKYIKSDIEFHSLLVKASKNERLIDFYSTLQYQILLIRMQVINLPGRPDKYFLDHKLIYDFLSKNDEVKAIKILFKHINQAKNDLIDHYSKIVNTKEEKK